MRAAGFEPEDYDNDVFEVWPENWAAFALFRDVGTQWRVGMGGPTGLDYTAVLAMFDLYGIDRAERLLMMADIQVMESAALGQMAKKD